MQISFAARGILNKLNEKFNNTNFLFAEFYDFDRGIDPYFKRRLCQVPMEERGKDWIAIMWSRDPQQRSLNNRLYTVALSTNDLYTSTTQARYVYCSIVFTYISNSMTYLERCEKQFFNYVPDGFSTYFDNTPYKSWNAKQNIAKGYRRLARRYNGYVYECVQTGTTGGSEPQWSASKEVLDGSVIWKPVEPDRLKVQLDEVAYSGLQKYSLDEEDTLCSLAIGGRMFLPLLLGELDEETGDLDYSDSANNLYPRILYPRDDISFINNYPEYEEYVTPTPEYWRNILGS
jgi:hypothetical protein